MKSTAFDINVLDGESTSLFFGKDWDHVNKKVNDVFKIKAKSGASLKFKLVSPQPLTQEI